MDREQLRKEYIEKDKETIYYRDDDTIAIKEYLKNDEYEYHKETKYYAEDGKTRVGVDDNFRNSQYKWSKKYRYDKTGENLIYNLENKTNNRYWRKDREEFVTNKKYEEFFRDLKTGEDISAKEFWKRLLEREPDKHPSEIYIEELGMTVQEFFEEMYTEGIEILSVLDGINDDYCTYTTEYNDGTSETYIESFDGTSERRIYNANGDMISKIIYDKEGERTVPEECYTEEKILLENGEERRVYRPDGTIKFSEKITDYIPGWGRYDCEWKGEEKEYAPNGQVISEKYLNYAKHEKSMNQKIYTSNGKLMATIEYELEIPKSKLKRKLYDFRNGKQISEEEMKELFEEVEGNPDYPEIGMGWYEFSDKIWGRQRNNSEYANVFGEIIDRKLIGSPLFDKYDTVEWGAYDVVTRDSDGNKLLEFIKRKEYKKNSYSLSYQKKLYSTSGQMLCDLQVEQETVRETELRNATITRMLYDIETGQEISYKDFMDKINSKCPNGVEEAHIPELGMTNVDMEYEIIDGKMETFFGESMPWGLIQDTDLDNGATMTLSEIDNGTRKVIRDKDNNVIIEQTLSNEEMSDVVEFLYVPDDVIPEISTVTTSEVEEVMHEFAKEKENYKNNEKKTRTKIIKYEGESYGKYRI